MGASPLGITVFLNKIHSSLAKKRKRKRSFFLSPSPSLLFVAREEGTRKGWNKQKKSIRSHVIFPKRTVRRIMYKVERKDEAKRRSGRKIASTLFSFTFPRSRVSSAPPLRRPPSSALSARERSSPAAPSGALCRRGPGTFAGPARSRRGPRTRAAR